MTTDLVPSFPSQLLEARLEEINIPVASYVRHGKHGMVRVGQSTRDIGARSAVRVAWHSQAGMPHRRAEREVNRLYGNSSLGVRRSAMDGLTTYFSHGHHPPHQVHRARLAIQDVAHAGKGHGQTKLKTPGKILSAKYGAMRDVSQGLGYAASSRSRLIGHQGMKKAHAGWDRARRPADYFHHRGPDPSVGKSKKSGHLSGTGRRILRDAPPTVLRGAKSHGPRLAKSAAGNVASSTLRSMPDGGRIMAITDALIAQARRKGNDPKKAYVARHVIGVYAALQRGDLDMARRHAHTIKALTGVSNIIPKRKR